MQVPSLMLVSITSLYAAILAIILVVLSFHVIRNRQKNEVDLGDGGNDTMMRAIRAQGNFVEYIPIALFLMFLLEINKESTTIFHVMGITLVVGRLLHPFSIIKGALWARVVSTLSTFITILVGAGLLLRAVL
jgi:uncharacterized membrane protein YecN with MAPEG domain